MIQEVHRHCWLLLLIGLQLQVSVMCARHTLSHGFPRGTLLYGLTAVISLRDGTLLLTRGHSALVSCGRMESAWTHRALTCYG